MSSPASLKTELIVAIAQSDSAQNMALFTQPPMRRMRLCFTDVFFVFFSFLLFPFATKMPDNRSRERLNGFS